MPNGRGMSCLEELNICFKGENLLGLYGRDEKKEVLRKAPPGDGRLARLFGLFADVGEDAAVDVENVAVDEVRRFGSEEHGGAHQILGCAPACGGRLGDNEGVERMARTVGLLLAQRGGLRRGDVTRADAVALDVVLAVLRGDVAREHLQTALGGSVGRHGLAAELRHHRADVDDLAVAFLDHRRNDGFRDDERTVEVDVDYLAELGGGHFVHGDALDDAGVVHKDVDHADLLLNRCNHTVDSLLVGDVAHISVRFNALLPICRNALVHKVLLNVVKYDGCTSARHRLSDRETNAVGCTCHKCDFSFQ